MEEMQKYAAPKARLGDNSPIEISVDKEEHPLTDCEERGKKCSDGSACLFEGFVSGFCDNSR